MPNVSTEPLTFQLLHFWFTRLSLHFSGVAAQQINMEHNLRIRAEIVDDVTIRAFLGAQVHSKELVRDGKPIIQAVVESVAEVRFASALPKTKLRADQIPMLANVLGVMMPFVREKTHSLLAANGIHMFLPVTNLQQVLVELASRDPEGKMVVDLRQGEPSPASV